MSWSFDLITFVASIHHLPLRESLQKARQMLRPEGELAVVGISANKTISGWTWAGLCYRPRALVRGSIARPATSAYSSLSHAKASVRSGEWPTTSCRRR
jgi:2-polyprenyl-3-methyl-5-hydroxy-6-metoxy-1,4-benzoquinol methylase